MDGKLKVGVVGVGYIGFHRAQKYQDIPEVELVGLVDPDPEVKEKAQTLEVPYFPSPAEIISRVDAVSIAVPTPQHFEIARDFLRRGKHVLLEKPITGLVSEADDLIRLARSEKVVLQVGHTERFNPIVEAMSGRVKDPRFFEIHRLSLFHDRGTEVDVVMDIMIHDLDIILELVPSPIKQVVSIGVPVLSPLVDIANARIEFENGAVANLTASRVSLKRMRKIRVFQIDGYLSVDCDRQEGVYCRRVNADDGGSSEHKIEVETLEVKKRDALAAETQGFIEAVRGKQQPRVGGEEGKRALALAERIIEGFKQSISALEGLNDHPDLFTWMNRVAGPNGSKS